MITVMITMMIWRETAIKLLTAVMIGNLQSLDRF
ncbi:MAG: hypothetical protein HRU19_26610 [Pseudobacteriovorax sp.]|nr:hypothetical protein [Pseudobacteriovorax sp.]